MRRVAPLLLLCLTGCLTRAIRVTRLTRDTGWYRVDAKLTLDADGSLRPSASEEPSDDPYMQHLDDVYESQFTQLWIDQESPCFGMLGAEKPPPGTVYLLVHGVRGVGHEWMKAIPTLAARQPAAIYMFKWVFYDERGHILDAMVKGIDRIGQCFPDNDLVLIGHSAGGVLGAFAASRITLSSEGKRRLDIITVAAPLAGIGIHPAIEDADDDTHFFQDLGSVRSGYPAAAPSVFVTHLRTQYPADHVMEPDRRGWAPNDPAAIVKGSKLIDVPATLGHDESLLWAVQQIAAVKLP